MRRIFDLYISGMGQNTIAKTLNEEGVPCPSEYKEHIFDINHHILAGVNVVIVPVNPVIYSNKTNFSAREIIIDIVGNPCHVPAQPARA